jgi:hypothetical protein
VIGFPANSRATMCSPVLFLPRQSTGVHRVPDVFPMVIPPRLGLILRSSRMAQTQDVLASFVTKGTSSVSLPFKRRRQEGCPACF